MCEFQKVLRKILKYLINYLYLYIKSFKIPMAKYVAKGNFLLKMFEVMSISLRDLSITDCNGPRLV